MNNNMAYINNYNDKMCVPLDVYGGSDLVESCSDSPVLRTISLCPCAPLSCNSAISMSLSPGSDRNLCIGVRGGFLDAQKRSNHIAVNNTTAKTMVFVTAMKIIIYTVYTSDLSAKIQPIKANRKIQ